MKQSVMTQENGCPCAGWAQNMPLVQRLLVVGETHSQEYEGASFRFCPWCGQPLPGVLGQRDEALVKKYQQRIEEGFFSEDSWGVPQMPNMLVAAHPVHDYRQSTGDVLGTLELMLAFVEAGARFTATYGDIDEPFYEGLELMLADFRKLLLAHPDRYEEADLAQRLADLSYAASDVGWGYGDYVAEKVTEIQERLDDV